MKSSLFHVYLSDIMSISHMISINSPVVASLPVWLSGRYSPIPRLLFPFNYLKNHRRMIYLSYQHNIMDPSTIQVESPVIIVSCGLVLNNFNFLHKISYVWRHLVHLLFNFTTWWVSSSQSVWENYWLHN
jgi:hypothetical protein